MNTLTVVMCIIGIFLIFLLIKLLDWISVAVSIKGLKLIKPSEYTVSESYGYTTIKIGRVFNTFSLSAETDFSGIFLNLPFANTIKHFVGGSTIYDFDAGRQKDPLKAAAIRRFGSQKIRVLEKKGYYMLFAI